MIVGVVVVVARTAAVEWCMRLVWRGGGRLDGWIVSLSIVRFFVLFYVDVMMLLATAAAHRASKSALFRFRRDLKQGI